MFTDLHEMTVAFYFCSLRNDFTGFDFDEAYDELEPYVTNKLNDHGLLDFESFRDNWEAIHGDAAALVPSEFTMLSDYIWFGEAQAAEAILRAMWSHAKETFEGYSEFQELLELKELLDCRPQSLQEQINLFDRLIHAQHVTGDLIEDLDTEQAKADAEDMYNEALEAA